MNHFRGNQKKTEQNRLILEIIYYKNIYFVGFFCNLYFNSLDFT